MKIKPIKICKNKGCSNNFRPYKSTDKYCSFQCAKDNAPKPKPRAKINTFSEKRKNESYKYTKKRKIFLAKPENKYCIVAKEVFNQTLTTKEVHHKAGRIGKLLLYVPYWLAVSSEGHIWIHNNPEESYKLNFLIHSSTK